MNKLLDTIWTWADSAAKDLLSYSLMGKLNGRLISYAMRVANETLNETTTNGIDGFNELMTDMNATLASMDFMSNAGLPQKSNREQLQAWANAYVLTTQAGFIPNPTLSDSLRFMLKNSMEQAAAKPISNSELTALARACGLPVVQLERDIVAGRQAKQQRDRERDALRFQAAAKLIAEAVNEAHASITYATDVGPQEFSSAVYTDVALPDDNDEVETLLLGVIASARKGRATGGARRGDSTEEILTDLALLKAEEDLI